MVNLISNAIKYTSKKNHRITDIGYTTEDEQVVYYVSDNGSGFDMEFYHKLFGVSSGFIIKKSSKVQGFDWPLLKKLLTVMEAGFGPKVKSVAGLPFILHCIL